MNKPIPFGKYYLLERINVGGMAEVFKAKAFGVEGFERLVAVKRILPNIAEDEEFITMFIDEAKIAVQLQHANVAQIFDLGKVDDSFFIALEYVYGRDLRAIFDNLRKSGEKMPTPQACYIIMQVCEGLDYAHNKRDAQGRELNLVHRDVSPQNVLVGYEGEIKLVDFGIAKAAGKASKTQAGILKGKFGYMSPEQVRGLPVDRRSDIFALGIVLYELLTGERLFVGESDFSTLEKVRNVEILPPSSFNRRIPPELERIILKALAKDVEDRYQNAIDLHDDLQAFLYSIGEFYSRKDLAAWMKKSFATELADENARNAQYEQLEEPTPHPSSGHGGSSHSSRSAHRAPAPLEWDEEELETQIFDKPQHGDFLPPPRAAAAEHAELSSADIFLAGDGGEEGDDKTVAGAPPTDILFGSEGGYGPASHSSLGRAQGGPPPGLSAYRQPTGTGYPTVPAAAPARSSGSYGAMNGQAAGQSSPFKQTLMGIPAPNFGNNGALPLPGALPPGGAPPAGAYGGGLGAPGPLARPTGAYGPVTGVPERRPLETMAGGRRGGSRLMPLGLTLVALAVGTIAGYKYFTRPGKLEIGVSPADATVTLDAVAIKGAPPFALEKRPGTYALAVTRDGYIAKDQQVQVRAGQTDRVNVQLEPVPETGFTLTSDPPGAPVWLDGQPMLGPDGKQAVTNFRANPVAPGEHILEIKGDPRFDDWKYPIYIEAGKNTPLHTVLQPRREGGGTSGRAAPAPSAAPVPSTDAEPSAAPARSPAVAPQPVKTPAPAAIAPESPAEAPAPPRAAAPTPRRPAPSRPARPAVVTEEEEPAAAAEDEELGRPAATRCSISINARPWAEVWVDGKNTGKITPLIDFDVPCGKRKLTFKNKDLGIEKSEAISIRAGERFKKVFSLVDADE